MLLITESYSVPESSVPLFSWKLGGGHHSILTRRGRLQRVGVANAAGTVAVWTKPPLPSRPARTSSQGPGRGAILPTSSLSRPPKEGG